MNVPSRGMLTVTGRPKAYIVTVAFSVRLRSAVLPVTVIEWTKPSTPIRAVKATSRNSVPPAMPESAVSTTGSSYATVPWKTPVGALVRTRVHSSTTRSSGAGLRLRIAEISGALVPIRATGMRSQRMAPCTATPPQVSADRRLLLGNEPDRAERRERQERGERLVVPPHRLGLDGAEIADARTPVEQRVRV